MMHHVMLCGVDGDLHAGLAVAGDAADEVVGAAGEGDAVVAGAVHLGAPGSAAALVPRRVHRRHVVRRRVVLEHQDVPGLEALAVGPAVGAEAPAATVADGEHRRLGDPGLLEEHAEDKRRRRRKDHCCTAASSLSSHCNLLAADLLSPLALLHH
jgi:hypothetical protein